MNLRSLFAPTQVWGRDPSFFSVQISDPVEEGFLHENPDAPHRPKIATIRPLLGHDHSRVDTVRRANAPWLTPWDATLPAGAREELPTLWEYMRRADRDQREGHSLILMPEFDGCPVGQFTLSQVQWGAMSQGVLGYWVAQEASRMGLASLVVSYMMDLVIGELGLHRIEVNVRPENERSLGLCRKLGLREEGYRERYMNIAGVWADHVSFAMDAESLPEGGMLVSLYGKGLR